MITSAKPITAEEFLLMPDDGKRHELVEGELTELTPPPGWVHGKTQLNTGIVLREFVRPRRLGDVVTETGFVISTDPDTVRAPDVAFVSAGRLPKGEPPTGYLRLVPDIAVEVVSPSDTASEIRSRARMWLEAGCRLVWVVYPASRSVTVYRSMSDAVTLEADDVLDGAPVLDGFGVSVSDLFE